MRGRRSTTRHGVLERYLPLGYFAMSLSLLVVLLPTVLRPPQDNPTTSAEFAPDVPPDEEHQEQILGELGRAQSGTAGAGEGEGIGDDTSEAPEAPPTESVDVPARACPFGVGDPPRQWQSVYAAPCAPAWSGDNGGETYQGVSRSEVRVAWFWDGGQNASYEGRVPFEEQENESAQDRTIRVFQQFFNEAFQLYGRTLQLYALDSSGGEEGQRAAAAKADEEWGVFGGAGVGAAVCEEFTRRELVDWCGGRPQGWYEERPYRYSWWMDQTRGLVDFGSEYLCKKLHDRPAEFAGDPTMHDQERVFGLIAPGDGEWNTTLDTFGQRVDQECDVELAETVRFTAAEGTWAGGSGGGGSQGGESEFASAVSRFRLGDVTTVIPFVDWQTAAGFTNSADGQGYSPEWFVPGTGALDRNQLAQLQNQRQWQNAFGFSADQMELQIQDMDCYRAYKRIDPDNDPQYGICTWFFPTMHMVVNGLQAAGPELTPRTYERGLQDIGYRFYEDPAWAVGGGFGPGDWTYMDDVVEIWWDPTAPDPQRSGNLRGAYRYVSCGKRYKAGELPRELAVFEDGVTAYEFPC